jgi:hypothetical protein
MTPSLKDRASRTAFAVVIGTILRETQVPPKLHRQLEILYNLLRDEDI